MVYNVIMDGEQKAGLTVVETQPFVAKVKKLLSEGEQRELIALLSHNPTCGDIIQGTNGVRKVRYALKGRGKSGGSRVIYYYHNDSMPLYLLTIFAKGEKANLSKAERNNMAKVVALIVAESEEG